MSGICGLLRLDGGPAEGITAMVACLERRGPDGTHVWRDGSVALGHTLLATTPEALHETLPLTDPATGCTITADVRLDNRDELLDALNLDAAGRVIGDGELLLRAWIAWGEGCLDRLLGDFAFILWDPRIQQLFAARDQMGTRQLAFAHRPGQLFAVATDPRAVIAAPGVPRDIDEGRIADYLEEYLESIDFESTFYTAVRRLPPAHCLSLNASCLTIRRYWSLVPRPPLDLPNDRDYAEAFLEVFTEAVRCRLRSAGPVGSMLSGGMDSGSVVAVASRLLAAEGCGPLPTFSVVSPDPATCRETRAIHSSLTMSRLDPHLIDISDLSPWADDLQAALRNLDEPFDGSMNLPRAVYVAARRAGVRVVLDGGGGDVVLNAGSHLAALLQAGNLRGLWREAVGEEWFWRGERTRWEALREAARHVVVPDWLRRLRRAWRRARDARPTGPLLSPAFAREVDLSARVARWEGSRPFGRSSTLRERIALITGPTEATGQERYDRVAGSMGVEARDPFRDLRVIDFCLRCPSGQMQSGGWPKAILRRAMRGLLPDEVVWKPGKPHLGWTLTRELMGTFTAGAAPVVSEPHRDLLRRATGLDYGQATLESLDESSRWNLWCCAAWLGSAHGPGSVPDLTEEQTCPTKN